VDRLSCHDANGSRSADNFRRFQSKALPKISLGETANYIVDRGRMEADENCGKRIGTPTRSQRVKNLMRQFPALSYQ
jgi:hypothetical protein